MSKFIGVGLMTKDLGVVAIKVNFFLEPHFNLDTIGLTSINLTASFRHLFSIYSILSKQKRKTPRKTIHKIIVEEDTEEDDCEDDQEDDGQENDDQDDDDRGEEDDKEVNDMEETKDKNTDKEDGGHNEDQGVKKLVMI
ncbi:probable dual specificity protein phosphatase DDB_G0281963 [Chenopodium quinoa]|uniref:probable dual specificity protein phosphatase DDB_G0281963 n=1 Tax=Chenopodium quinoa TaxID=63459 RepID=UPI000B7762E9|nr:probable dual specificity protein phosphatase DDB_G0281963 [Chenopodium quinoa]